MPKISNPRAPQSINKYPILILRVWNKYNPKNKWYFILDYDSWYNKGYFDFYIPDFHGDKGEQSAEYFSLWRNDKYLRYNRTPVKTFAAGVAAFDFIENPQISFTKPPKQQF